MPLSRIIKVFLKSFRSGSITTLWFKSEPTSVLHQIFTGEVHHPLRSKYRWQIEILAEKTNSYGVQPLWEGYRENNIGGPTRLPNGVRTNSKIGNMLSDLVTKVKPDIVVEFGTAFGVSGMYFLAGIKKNGKGKLLSFEPNPVWAGFAEQNLSALSDQFELTVGTFEENINKVLKPDEMIDIAFIDAIHTREFVMPQLELVISRSKKGSLIILDDINFSWEMNELWKELATDDRFIASIELDQRVGILEL